METLSALLVLFEVNPLVVFWFPSQRSSNTGIWWFTLQFGRTICWTNCRVGGDLRHFDTRNLFYDLFRWTSQVFIFETLSLACRTVSRIYEYFEVSTIKLATKVRLILEIWLYILFQFNSIFIDKYTEILWCIFHMSTSRCPMWKTSRDLRLILRHAILYVISHINLSECAAIDTVLFDMRLQYILSNWVLKRICNLEN